MASGKLDLPDDLLSSQSSDHSSNPRVEAPGAGYEEKVVGGVHDDVKDQAALDNSIPLSPQWLYNKPSDTRMDLRAPAIMPLGNSNDPTQKDGWRLDGSEEKKDWRRIGTENEGTRRWREEERETSLLGARRDRRKTDRRVDSAPIRETTDTRALPSSDWWHDGSNRNSGHDGRRDSKWSSRWGPEDKEKEPRTEKKTDVEKEKEDTHKDIQSSVGGNRSVLERDSDSRDKWRPRHRMEAHAAGSTPYRAAPGFGAERGRVEGSNVGFSIGRGRSNGVGRSSSAGSTAAAHYYKSGNVIGKPEHATDAYCYPRGKLLDIYRQQRLDLSVAARPVEMEETPPITEMSFVEPMAFVSPETEEEAILTDMWKGKITNSGVVYNSSRKGRPNENVSGIGDSELVEGNHGTLLSVINGEITVTLPEVANDGMLQTGHENPLWSQGSHLNVLNDNKLNDRGVDKAITDEFTARGLKCDGSDSTSYAAAQLSYTLTGSFIDEKESASLDVKSKLPDDSNSLLAIPSSEQNGSSIIPHLGMEGGVKEQEKGVPPEDLYFFYIDPQGNTQGPFLGADIFLWFEEGYFGTELPVRLADAPEGTPFRNLGEVIPNLKLKGGFPNSELENSRASGVNLESSVPLASVPEITGSSTVNDLYQPLSEFNSLSGQQAKLRMSEPEAPLQLPHSEGQNFQDFVPQEEIVFPGRPRSGDYSNIKSSVDVTDRLLNSNIPPSLSNKLTEPGLQYQNDHKLHPFGLLWSELEGSHARQTETSDMSSTAGRAASIGAMNDLAYDQFLSRQFLQQEHLQHQNMLAQHARINEARVEHVPSQNFTHQQQLANNHVADLEHIMALQLQRQQQLQLQQQQQLQQLQQQQQFQQQQKLLHERQQSQARQVLLERLLHGQIPDPGIPLPRVDPMRPNNVLDQVLVEQQLRHEMQQRSHHPARHFGIEQLTQAKFGQAPQQELQRDLYELLHGQMQPLEQQLRQQEQLQARQLSMGLRQLSAVDEERHIESVWPGSENDQFLRHLTGNRRVNSSGINASDIYQQHQRPVQEERLSHLERTLSLHDRLRQGLYEPGSLPVSLPQEDQLSLLERNLSFQDRLRQGLYDAGSVPFERSMSLPAGAPRMNMDAINAMVHARDVQELSGHMQSAGQLGEFSSGVHLQNSRQTLVPNQFHGSRMDSIEGPWPESNRPLTNDWMESRIQQLQINAGRQKREEEAKLSAEDPNLWMSDELNDDKSRRLLMELLHQKSGHQPTNLSHINNEISFERRAAAGLFTGSNASNHPFTVFSDHEASNSFAPGSYGSSASELAEIASVNEQTNSLQNNEKLPFVPESTVRVEGSSGISQTGQAAFSDSKLADKSSMEKGYIEVEDTKHGSKSRSMSKISLSDNQDGLAEQTRLAARDRGEFAVNTLSRQSSSGVSGFYDDKSGPQSSFSEDISRNQVSLSSKGPENILLRRPPVARTLSSQEGLSELDSDTIIRGKGPSSNIDGVNPVSQGTDNTAFVQKDVRFRRTSSYSDADVSEPSFSDMLKSNAKKATATEVQVTGAGSDALDGMQMGKGSKKKGKKGRQIDPALLGFKVTSNRIMMGEIQRIDD